MKNVNPFLVSYRLMTDRLNADIVSIAEQPQNDKTKDHIKLLFSQLQGLREQFKTVIGA